jgi:hypothetical protein
LSSAQSVLETAGLETAGLEIAGLEIAGLEIAGLEIAGNRGFARSSRGMSASATIGTPGTLA